MLTPLRSLANVDIPPGTPRLVPVAESVRDGATDGTPPAVDAPIPALAPAPSIWCRDGIVEAERFRRGVNGLDAIASATTA